MATQKQVINMIATIKTIYSYYAKDIDVETLAKTWGVLLQDYPDDIVKKAFYKAMQTCKTPPTPADVIENIKAIATANEPTDEELWSVFTKALPKVREYMYRLQYPMYGDPKSPHERIADLYNGFPDKVQQYIGSANELKRMSQYSDDDLKFEKAKFLKAMPTIQKRQEYSGLMLTADNKKLIE